MKMDYKEGLPWRW